MDSTEEAMPDVGRAFRGLASLMEDYEAQQICVGQVLDTLLSRMPSVSPVTGNPPASVTPPSIASSAMSLHSSTPPWATPLWEKNSPLTCF